MDFLKLFDHAVREAKPILDGYETPTSLDVEIGDLGVDSLDVVMILTILGDVYEVTEDVMDRDLNISTVGALQSFLTEKGGRVPATLEEAEGWME